MQKRLLAVLLVLVLAFSATTTVYAEEVEPSASASDSGESQDSSDSGSSSSDSSSESSSGSSSDSSSGSSSSSESAPAQESAPSAPVSVPESAPAPVAEAVAPAVQAVAAASESIGMAHEVLVTEFDLNSSVVPYLDEAAVYINGGTLPNSEAAETPAAGAEGQDAEAPAEAAEITGAYQDLETAQSILEKIDVIDTSRVDAATENTTKELTVFKEKTDEAEQLVESATQSAETANTSGSKQEATAAKEQAEVDLAKAEANLSEATDAYDAAWKEADKAQTAYEEALAEQEAAQKKIEEAQAALDSAKEKSIAAQKALKKAQDEAAKIESRVQELKENRDDLKAIRDQYYASMVYYYRSLIGKDTVYEDDGTLNIEENAKKVVESGKAEKAALNADKSSMQLNRYLAKMLIDYLITNDANVDPATANLVIGAPETGTVSQKASQGTVFTNAEGQDQTVVEGSKKDIDGNRVYAGEQTSLNMTRSNQSDGGRTNRIKVTYTDKDGVDHEEYYNYIYKSKQYDGEIDVENGAIYLALVKYDEESKKWEASRVEDENNFDDYTKLTQALQAIEDLEKYEKAREAVDEAAERVTTLEEMIASLSIESPSNLNKLEEALDQARAELEEATERKLELEGVVEEARKAVAGIDLSRFDVWFVDEEAEADEESSSAGTAATGDAVASAPVEMNETEIESAFATISGLPTIPVAIVPMIPEVTPVAGITAESPFANITLAGNMTEARESESNLLNYRTSMMPAALTPDEQSVVLDDSELAGAKGLETTQKQKSFWAWLLLAISSILGLGFLHRKKEQEEEQAEQVR